MSLVGQVVKEPHVEEKGSVNKTTFDKAAKKKAAFEQSTIDINMDITQKSSMSITQESMVNVQFALTDQASLE